MQIIRNAHIATMASPDDYGYWEGAILILDGTQIRYVGMERDIPDALHADILQKYSEFKVVETDCEGRLITPALIDCHTHILYGGSRAKEFEQRLHGASYEEIAQAGGGILSTVENTREASDEELLKSALQRIDRILAEGVCTVEVKSGYGLDYKNELRMLRLARQIEIYRDVDIYTSFLGAHAVPKGMNSDEYLDEIVIPTLVDAAEFGLADAVDGFCENIGFTREQISRLFDTARALKLPVKLHAEQLSNQNGASLCALYNGLSADHLEYIDEEGVAMMALSGTVAVILPLAYYFLRETRKPPIASFRKAGVAMAVASDSNPGSAPGTSLLLAMNMAATLFGMTPQEALRGTTINAARALGIEDRGVLAPGKRADLAIWDVEHPAELVYRIGDAPLYQRIYKGEKVKDKGDLHTLV